MKLNDILNIEQDGEEASDKRKMTSTASVAPVQGRLFGGPLRRELAMFGYKNVEEDD